MLRLILHGDTELQVTTRDMAAGSTAEKLAGAYKSLCGSEAPSWLLSSLSCRS